MTILELKDMFISLDLGYLIDWEHSIQQWLQLKLSMIVKVSFCRRFWKLFRII